MPVPAPPTIGLPLPRAADARPAPEALAWLLAEHGHGREWARVLRVPHHVSARLWSVGMESDIMSYAVPVPGGRYTELAELAGEQYGYVTQVDARGLGIPSDSLVKMARRGQLERVSTGVYRMALIPPTPLDPYMQATLWPVGPRGVLSHETALDLHALSDINPAQIHLTVPVHHRPRRAVPRVYAIHHADLREDELTLHEGLPIVTAERAIRECHAAHLGPALIRQAIDDAERIGLLSRVKVGLLREELLGVGARG